MTDPIQGTAELLFVGSGEGGFEIDCVVLEECGRNEPRMVPMTLWLSEPKSAVLRWTIERRLAAWASEGAIVKMRLESRRGRPRARLESETTRLNLELAGAAGF